ncbi:unnamed protein product [Pleuronectes platessa]|uniref:VLIG-type G domain-containing protein n=1 Tax=Pleuronectes platessa TaxID=8262 RepID=A0A9N7YU14_PLEPL|nr:unnamed protein product [Pleuronectes platessa]
MGLIYEFSTSSSTTADEMSQLPGLAADMLLDGYPLELLDGDASNVPERWVTAVLMELHKKVGQRSRLLVLTVLGVQSTEGLKAPDLAQLEDSYEHDNQLATFVIGLSDATIINIAMENAAEMKDVLQIAVHAFLRMKEIGKKPVCHFVHQNVSSVSAHDKNITDRKHLLDQLNEMTQIAAEMEKKPSIKEFTDVLDYDMDKNNWNIPGLWHGTPPMAPVNTGYSEAVAHFKKNLLQTVKKDPCNEVSQIPEFLEWMKSLWKAVKYENFIFSFRNTLVAHAYDNLCKEFNQWEWEFRKQILTWQTQAEVEILNADNESEDWIFEHIREKMSEDKTLCKLKNNNLQVIYDKISEAIDRAAIGEDGAPLPDNKESITKLISNMRKHLIKDISLSVEAEKTTLFQIQSSCHSFIKCLKISMKELKDQLEEEFSNSDDITETLNKLPIKPQDELFKRVFGCGRQCPFCYAPCEAGGKEHKVHHAAIHRPQGLGNLKYESSKELVDSLCTTEVHSDRSFKKPITKGEWHPYKDYNKYYPDWIIPPDSTIEASDYWNEQSTTEHISLSRKSQEHVWTSVQD